MRKKHKDQIKFILEVTRRYKENGGYIWRVLPGGRAKVRCSLAEFILLEVGALLEPKP